MWLSIKLQGEGWWITGHEIMESGWWVRCLLACFWLDLITNASQDRRDTGPGCWQYYKWHQASSPWTVYTCFDNTGHELQGDIGKATGDELANTRRIYLSAHHLEVWSYKTHNDEVSQMLQCYINTNEKHFYFALNLFFHAILMWKWDWLLTFLFSGMRYLWTFLIVVHGTWHERSNKLRLTPEATSALLSYQQGLVTEASHWWTAFNPGPSLVECNISKDEQKQT